MKSVVALCVKLIPFSHVYPYGNLKDKSYAGVAFENLYSNSRFILDVPT
jgi:hypothetical protein